MLILNSEIVPVVNLILELTYTRYPKYVVHNCPALESALSEHTHDTPTSPVVDVYVEFSDIDFNNGEEVFYISYSGSILDYPCYDIDVFGDNDELKWLYVTHVESFRYY